MIEDLNEEDGIEIEIETYEVENCVHKHFYTLFRLFRLRLKQNFLEYQGTSQELKHFVYTYDYKKFHNVLDLDKDIYSHFILASVAEIAYEKIEKDRRKLTIY